MKTVWIHLVFTELSVSIKFENTLKNFALNHRIRACSRNPTGGPRISLMMMPLTT